MHGAVESGRRARRHWGSELNNGTSGKIRRYAAWWWRWRRRRCTLLPLRDFHKWKSASKDFLGCLDRLESLPTRWRIPTRNRDKFRNCPLTFSLVRNYYAELGTVKWNDLRKNLEKIRLQSYWFCRANVVNIVNKSANFEVSTCSRFLNKKHY